jgi:hypothetical protein
MFNSILRLACSAYTVALLLAATPPQQTPAPACKATTKAGQPCKLKTRNPSGLCQWHDPAKIAARRAAKSDTTKATRPNAVR